MKSQQDSKMIEICKFRIKDVESISYLQPEGWSDITFYFRFYCKHNFCYPIKAICGDRIIGVANATLNAATGWLAHIIVAEEFRHRGIGYLLTEQLIQHLKQKGCLTQLLIATQMGKGLYRKLGFETVSEYLFFAEGALESDISDKHIQHLQDAELPGLLKLDRKVTGENRARMLMQFLEDTYVYVANSGLQGFFLPKFGEGTIIAADETAGLALLQFKHNRYPSKTVLPVENIVGTEFLLEHGFQLIDKAPRMLLGEKIPWQPALVFSRAGGFYG